MKREFKEITEEMVGLEDKATCCSTVADLLIMGRAKEIDALKENLDPESREERE